MTTGKTSKPAIASAPFRAADYIRSEKELAVFLQELFADGDARAVPAGLRVAADVLGGMAELARRTGLSRESLYRTLSANGNPRLDTLSAILAAFGLRLSVAPKVIARRRAPTTRTAKVTRPAERRATTSSASR